MTLLFPSLNPAPAMFMVADVWLIAWLFGRLTVAAVTAGMSVATVDELLTVPAVTAALYEVLLTPTVADRLPAVKPLGRATVSEVPVELTVLALMAFTWPENITQFEPAVVLKPAPVMVSVVALAGTLFRFCVTYGMIVATVLLLAAAAPSVVTPAVRAPSAGGEVSVTVRCELSVTCET